MMRVLVADDEPVAVERLELALSCIPEVEVIGAARSGRDALRLIRELRPDIAILDIQMPGQSGFDVLQGLRAQDHLPEIIFVTAFDGHAVKAFEVHAVDYLLKPVAFERLRDAIRRASLRLQARAADKRFAELEKVIAALSAPAGPGARSFEKELWVRENDGIRRLAVESIDLFEAAGDYVIAHVEDTTHLLSDSLNSLEERLDPAVLLRVHRSSIVNLKRVRSLRKRGSRGLALVLQSGRQISVGPSYANTVMEAMNAKRWR
jgi:DNA-binding LytR/AlgR family response regulator